jgi:hypothetical protein
MIKTILVCLAGLMLLTGCAQWTTTTDNQLANATAFNKLVQEEPFSQLTQQDYASIQAWILLDQNAWANESAMLELLPPVPVPTPATQPAKFAAVVKEKSQLGGK